MREEYLSRVPEWYRSFEKFDVVLSDDLDGIVSTSALKFAKNWNVEYFYDFSKLYVTGQTYFKENKNATRVWADVAITRREMTFDNHISRKNLGDKLNDLCINPNVLTNVTNENYYDKYCGSSALLIWSLYNIPLPETELGKMLLLCIDSTFKGFFGYNNFKERNRFYLCDVLGFEELYEVEKRHSREEFYELITKYNLGAKTTIDKDGYLHTDLDLDFIGKELGIELSIPTDKCFIEWRELEEHKVNNFYGDVASIKRLITLAYTGKNFVMYSTMA